MNIFKLVNGQMILMAPEEAEDGAAGSGPAGEDAGSESESEFEDMAESFESDSYDDAEEGQSDEESDAGEETTVTEEESEGDDEGDSGEEESEEDADEGESKDEESEEEGDEEEDEGEKPEPLTDEQIEEYRNQYIDKMAEQFQISEEDADALRTEPEKVMPRLMAKAMTSALEQMAGVMKNNLPKLVDGQLTQQSKAKEIETKFYGKYPELNSKKALKVTEQMARAYRQANPDADLDETMDNVAFMAWKKLGLPMDKLSERMNGDQAEEFNSSQQQRTEKKGGFKPANAGKTGQGNPGAREQKPNSEFEEIANLLQNDSMFDD
jgi:hypothetical protein